MSITIKPGWRAPLIGIAAALLLIGAFMLGTTRSSGGSGGSGAVLTSASGTGKITVTGSGSVTGTPDQLVLSMGVQVKAASVSSALSQANQATTRVIAALTKDGVVASDIQTAGLSISPDYRGRGQAPVSYEVSEQLTATLTDLAKAGTEIQDAVTAGGNAATVDGVSLKLTDTGKLLAAARAAAIRDAQAKASQFAGALHQPLGAVISVSDQTTNLPSPVYYGVAEPNAASAVPISPGTQKVSVQITVVYAIG